MRSCMVAYCSPTASSSTITLISYSVGCAIFKSCNMYKCEIRHKKHLWGFSVCVWCKISKSVKTYCSMIPTFVSNVLMQTSCTAIVKIDTKTFWLFPSLDENMTDIRHGLRFLDPIVYKDRLITAKKFRLPSSRRDEIQFYFRYGTNK